MSDADSILFSEMEVILKSPDFLRRNGFPSRVLMESRARIESLKARVVDLEAVINKALKSMEGLEREPFVGETFEILEKTNPEGGAE